MTQGTSGAARTAPSRPARHVSLTDRGDLVVRVPATLLEVAVVLAVLAGLAAVPVVAAGVVPTVAALPLALVGLAAVFAAALVAPFAALALLAARLG
jgi:predicted transcriptional regulator